MGCVEYWKLLVRVSALTASGQSLCRLLAQSSRHFSVSELTVQTKSGHTTGLYGTRYRGGPPYGWVLRKSSEIVVLVRPGCSSTCPVTTQEEATRVVGSVAVVVPREG